MSSVVHHAIDVAAAPEACWAVFADLATWPSWFPLIKGVRALDGAEHPWRIGARLELLLDVGPVPLPLPLTVQEIEPATRVRWTGGKFGVNGDHYYTFQSSRAGLTRFTSHEEFSGFSARFIPRPVMDRIDDEVHRSMARFKALVERADVRSA